MSAVSSVQKVYWSSAQRSRLFASVRDKVPITADHKIITRRASASPRLSGQFRWHELRNDSEDAGGKQTLGVGDQGEALTKEPSPKAPWKVCLLRYCGSARGCGGPPV
jgi:hypothetical protein